MSRLQQKIPFRLPGLNACRLVIGVFTLLAFAQTSLAQAAEIKDPMQPPQYALNKYREAKNKNKPVQPKTTVQVKKETKKMQLTSIIYSPTRKIAIIDDQMLGVGGTINGARVVKISKRSARLVKKGKVINLHLPDYEGAVKKTLVESET